MKNAFLLFSVLLLSACASNIMQGYVGKPITEPILDYGPPTNVINVSETERAFQWRMDNSGVVPITSPSTATMYGTGGAATVYSQSTTYVPYSNSCLYTLMAKPQGTNWIVTGYRKPSLACE